MKNLFYVFFCTIIFLSCTTTQKTEPVHSAAIMVNNLNVLYIGIDNPLTIAVSGITNDNLKVTISQGSIQGENGNYIARVSSSSENATIEVSTETEPGNFKLIDKINFRVMKIPNPYATLDGKYNSGKIPVSKFQESKELTAVLGTGCVLDLNYKVLSYEMLFQRKGQDLRLIRNNGAMMNDKIINIISEAHEGDLAIFHEILIESPDGVERKLGGLTFELI